MINHVDALGVCKLTVAPLELLKERELLHQYLLSKTSLSPKSQPKIALLEISPAL